MTKQTTQTKTKTIKKAELEFVAGKPTKESMLLVIPSLLEELAQDELNEVYGIVWHLTAKQLLVNLNKNRVEELEEQVKQLKLKMGVSK